MHLQMTEEDRALEPVVQWHDERDRGCSLVHVCTWDRAGLFGKLAGALTAGGLNILSAQIFTREDGIVFDSFQIVDARSGEPPEPRVRDRVEKWVRDILVRGADPRPAIAKAAQIPALYHAPGGEGFPPAVKVEEDAPAERTMIEIIAEDRVGLLYSVAQAMYDLGLDLVLAKIVTEKGAAIDTFYVTEEDGSPMSAARRKEAAKRLLAEIEGA